jgi:hypothetical protein
MYGMDLLVRAGARPAQVGSEAAMTVIVEAGMIVIKMDGLVLLLMG